MEERAKTDQPFCSNCGYLLVGLTESSKCPECGKPLVDVLMRRSFLAKGGKRYESNARIFGWPVISIAIGPGDGQVRGTARGLIAIGDLAIGGIAIGGAAFGVVAIGGVAIGVCALAGLAIGLLCAMGGGAISAGISVGGGAVGFLAVGGGAVGIIAVGDGAIGQYVRTIRGSGMSSSDIAFFGRWQWLFGRHIGWAHAQAYLVPLLGALGMFVLLAFAIGLVALIQIRLQRAGHTTGENR